MVEQIDQPLVVEGGDRALQEQGERFRVLRRIEQQGAALLGGIGGHHDDSIETR